MKKMPRLELKSHRNLHNKQKKLPKKREICKKKPKKSITSLLLCKKIWKQNQSLNKNITKFN